MSPMPKSRAAQTGVPNTLYTAILTVALGVVLATAGYVAFTCFTQYGTIFGIG